MATKRMSGTETTEACIKDALIYMHSDYYEAIYVAADGTEYAIYYNKMMPNYGTSVEFELVDVEDTTISPEQYEEIQQFVVKGEFSND